MFTDEMGEYFVYRKDLHLSLSDGRKLLLSEVLRDCYTFLSNYLVDQKVISDYPTFFPIPGRVRLGREKVRELALEAVSGYPFAMMMQLLRFDSDSGKEVPIDLTGSKIEGHIYAPAPIVYEISLKQDSTGKEGKRAVELTHDESNQCRSFSTQEDQEKYFR
jgi:hypothetical protein